MELKNCGVVKRDYLMELAPGFRFHPTDEELISHYLSKKVVDANFTAIAIGEVDMNKVEPWDLPWRAKLGEKEWYFFCVRDKKYPTGMRTNRATAAGYWKATGKDKEIFRAAAGKTKTQLVLVGMKKTLVFYRGRAPKGEKSNWVCHEYRLEGKFSIQNFPKPTKNDWVISRVFQKTSGGKKVHISGLMRMNNINNPHHQLPPLMDHQHSPILMKTKPESESGQGQGHVHCFSNTIFPAPPPPPQKIFQVQEDSNPPIFFPSSSSNIDNPHSHMDSFPSWVQFPTVEPGIGFQVPIQDPSILMMRTFLANHHLQGFRNLEREMVMSTVSQETETGISNTENSSVVSSSTLEMGNKTFFQGQKGHAVIGTSQDQDLECIWNY